MTHAEICPVCSGSGVYYPAGYTVNQSGEVCHGCDGRGWVVVW